MRFRRRFNRQHRTVEEGLSLFELDVGKTAEIVGFSGCGHFIKRANNLGFHVGAKVKKIQNLGNQTLVQIGDCKMGLGMKASSKILVNETEED